MQNKPLLLSSYYFPPVQYFAKILQHKNIYIEAHENFNKQTYRNRCRILGANGIQPLVFPVQKGKALKTKIRDLKIDYSENWQRQHLLSIQSAYNHSPFFEFYIDDLMPFFTKKFEYVLDFNTEILQKILSLLDIELSVSFTSAFVLPKKTHFVDYRYTMHPKNKNKQIDKRFVCEKYYQVFNEKYSFQPNLSILDLLFNLGTETEMYLLRCWQT